METIGMRPGKFLPRGKSTELIILLHGFRISRRYLSGIPKAMTTAQVESGADSMGSVIEEIETNVDTDILIPDYKAGLFSNADVFLLASQLEQLIDRTFENRKSKGGTYERVVLIGHSVGAVLLRKAYVYALGATDDHPFHRAPTQAKEWTGRVDRLVLIAGMNRGWDVSPRPDHMRTTKFLRYWLLIRIANLTRSGRLILNMRRGTPFISNLRIQWLRLCHDSTKNVAPAIQLLGDTDDFIAKEDSKDLAAAANFIYVPVPASGHYNIIDFADSHNGETRKKLFLEATNRSIAFLKQRHYASTSDLHKIKTTLHKARDKGNAERDGDIVFLLHGIRDFGDWTRHLEIVLRQKDSGIRVITSGYGYFPILRFLIFGARHRNVRRFMDWYTAELANNPNRGISFVGHSNATFILSKAISDYLSCRIKHAVLLGSIVPVNFPWDRYIDQECRVTALRNDVCRDDWVVAVFGRFFEAICEMFGLRIRYFREIGSSGFNGFTDNSAHKFETKSLRGGHSAGLTPQHFDSIANFILDGDHQVSSTNVNTETSRGIVWCSKFSVLLVAIAVGLIAAPLFWLVDSSFWAGVIYAFAVYIILLFV